MALADDDLEALAVDLESDRVERTASSSDPDGIGQAVCAFANDLVGHRSAGTLLIGVHDAGRPAHRSPTASCSNTRTSGTRVGFSHCRS